MAAQERLVTVARFDYPYEAEVAAAKLRDAGIACHVSSGQVPGMPMFYKNSGGALRLQVPAAEADEAADVLSTLDDEEEPGDEPSS